MSRLPHANPQPPDSINSPPGSGLGEFGWLLVTLSLVAVVGTAILVLAAERLAPLIPFTWEKAVAGDAVPTVTVEDPEARDALKALTRDLVQAAELPKGMDIRVHLAQQSQPNAYATLGGNVIITRGLLDHVETENGLAMVLAHEIAHVRERHPIQALGRSAIFSLVWAVVSGATGQPVLQDVLGSAGMMTVLGFNRDMEREADTAGLATLRSHYGHVHGAGEFFRNLPESPGGEAPVFLRTHPRSDDRLARLAAEARGEAPGLEPLPSALAALREDDASGKPRQ